MKTFKQLNEELDKLINRKVILNHLVEIIEKSFSGKEPDLTLMRPDKLPVPEEAFESTVSELLLELKAIDTAIEDINKTQVTSESAKTTAKEKN